MFECNFDFYTQRINPTKYVVPIHSHTCYELVYYYSSGGFTNINGKKYYYKPGDFIIIPPLAHHDDHSNDETEIICIGFYYDDIEFKLAEGVYSDSQGKIKNLLENLLLEIQEKKNHYSYAANLLLKQILIEINRFLLPVNSEAGQHDSIMIAIRYIEQYFLTEIDMQQLAKIAQYSYHRFRHIFKQKMGVSPKQYILKKRIVYAKKQLLETNVSITELSYACGFCSTSQFIKTFKEFFDITPQQYRKKQQKNTYDNVKIDNSDTVEN